MTKHIVVTKEPINETSTQFDYDPTRFQKRRWKVDEDTVTLHVSKTDNVPDNALESTPTHVSIVSAAIRETNQLPPALSWVPTEALKAVYDAEKSQ